MQHPTKKKTTVLILGSLFTVWLIPSAAYAQLEWRVSVKILLDENGERPCEGDEADPDCNYNTDAEIIEGYEGLANDLLAPISRGYSFRVTEIVELSDLPAPPAGFTICDGGVFDGQSCGTACLVCDGGADDGEMCTEDEDCPDGACESDTCNFCQVCDGGANDRELCDDNAGCPGGFCAASVCVDAQSWFDVPIGGDGLVALETAVMDDPVTFEWREDAMNVYILGSPGTGWCSTPMNGREVTILGQKAFATSPLHEAGHFIGLCHTQGCECGVCDPDEEGVCHDFPGDDFLDDTLLDLPCYQDLDAVSYANFETSYASLPPAQQQMVDNTFYNLMSYHDDRLVFTSDQLDLMTDVSNNPWEDPDLPGRHHMTNGYTHFVDPTGDDNSGDGSSSAPYQTLQGGLNAAGATGTTDIVMLRGGNYDQTIPVEIDAPVYIRASRGNAVIGYAP